MSSIIHNVMHVNTSDFAASRFSLSTVFCRLAFEVDLDDTAPRFREFFGSALLFTIYYNDR